MHIITDIILKKTQEKKEKKNNLNEERIERLEKNTDGQPTVSVIFSVGK